MNQEAKLENLSRIQFITYSDSSLKSSQHLITQIIHQIWIMITGATTVVRIANRHAVQVNPFEYKLPLIVSQRKACIVIFQVCMKHIENAIHLNQALPKIACQP